MKNQEVPNIKAVLGKLKRVNYISLMHLIEFLKDEVVSRESKNKMNYQNVAICFAPCLMHSEVPSIQDLIYAGKSVAVVKATLEHFEEIFGDKKKQRQSYRKSYLLEKKKSIEISRISIAEEANYRNSTGFKTG